MGTRIHRASGVLAGVISAAIAVLLLAGGCNSGDHKGQTAEERVWQALPSSGIPACDAYLRYVCSCAKRHPEVKDLVYGCRLARRMVPEWKTREHPDRETIIESCIRAGEALEDSGQCGAFVH